MKNTLYILILFLYLFSCSGKKQVEDKVKALPPMTFPGISWEEKTPEELGVDSKILQTALDTLESYCGEDGVEEVVLIRNGYLIYKSDSCRKKHGVWSTTKSYTSTILGLLQDRGVVSVEKFAAEYDPDLKELYPKVQLKHFATHTSGYDAVGRNRWSNGDDDWSPTMLKIGNPLFEPGTHFLYYDEAMEMYGKVLTLILGETLESYIRENLLNYIGVTSFSWGSEYQTRDGIPICRGCSDLETNALDLARFGHLYLNKGNWNGKRLLSTEWVEEATSNQVPLEIEHMTEHRPGSDGRGVYGYNFWLNGIMKDGNSAMPDTPVSTFYTSGFNNNMCFIIPEWKMVFVRMGLDGNPPEGKTNVYNRFFKVLSKGVYDRPIV